MADAKLMQPRDFNVAGEGSIASYSYTDIAEGSGIVDFYGFCSNDSLNGQVYNLSNHVYYSSQIQESTMSQASFTFNGLPFNLPKNVKGTAFLSTGVYSDDSDIAAIHVTLYKIDGVTLASTALTSTITSELVNSTQKRVLVKMPLSFTHFKKGDYMSMTVKISGATGTGGTYAFGCDPQDRAGTLLNAGNTKMILSIPFKVDL